MEFWSWKYTVAVPVSVVSSSDWRPGVAVEPVAASSGDVVVARPCRLGHQRPCARRDQHPASTGRVDDRHLHPPAVRPALLRGLRRFWLCCCLVTTLATCCPSRLMVVCDSTTNATTGCDVRTSGRDGSSRHSSRSRWAGDARQPPPKLVDLLRRQPHSFQNLLRVQPRALGQRPGLLLTGPGDGVEHVEDGLPDITCRPSSSFSVSTLTMLLNGSASWAGREPCP